MPLSEYKGEPNCDAGANNNCSVCGNFYPDHEVWMFKCFLRKYNMPLKYMRLYEQNRERIKNG